MAKQQFPLLVAHGNGFHDAPGKLFCGYPSFYQREDRTFRNFHIAGLPLWVWRNFLRRWLYVRTCRCWICGKGFGLNGKSWCETDRKYMMHASCATKGGGVRIHPEIAEALIKHLDKQRQATA